MTVVYTFAPFLRTPEDVVAALLLDRDLAAPTWRPHPLRKEVRATLEGKEVAITRLAHRVQ